MKCFVQVEQKLLNCCFFMNIHKLFGDILFIVVRQKSKNSFSFLLYVIDYAIWKCSVSLLVLYTRWNNVFILFYFFQRVSFPVPVIVRHQSYTLKVLHHRACGVIENVRREFLLFSPFSEDFLGVKFALVIPNTVRNCFFKISRCVFALFQRKSCACIFADYWRPDAANLHLPFGKYTFKYVYLVMSGGAPYVSVILNPTLWT